MTIYPVILCGGSGTRLWPASRPDRPKQFIDLVGARSLFQQTVDRVRPLADDGGLIVVAGRTHRRTVLSQLAGAGVAATVLLEPEGRDSAPAMAAAAAWVARRDPDGLLLFVASDHHIPDGGAFRDAVRAGAAAARDGRIVTFGVRPTAPATAYGYIRPKRDGLSDVEAFVEKPDRATAERYIAEGYLWNSGNFMVSAARLRDQLKAHAPGVFEAADQALGAGEGDVVLLGDAFRTAPKISIDYAVMERSDRVSVLPVDFAWSDLGAWDAVAATGERGAWIGRTEGDGNFVRAAPGMAVATSGITGLAVIAEPDAVLVCRLDDAQSVKDLADQARNLQTFEPRSAGLEASIDGFDAWMRLSALPLWATLGVDADGGFVESLNTAGRGVADFRRARVQARQAYVFAAAGRMDWSGPWRRLVSDGLRRFGETNLRPDGLYRTRVGRDGAVLDETATLYDQAFVLLAYATAAGAGLEPQAMAERAHALRQALDGLRHPQGGWREAGDHPFQANAHMHLLEAGLAWEALDSAGPWSSLCDEIVALARRAFIDGEGGFLREFFADNWRPAPGADGRVVEPGHQFEWSWLLTRWGRSRGDDWAMQAARRLYAAGARGVDHARGVAVDQLGPSLRLSDGEAAHTARLWPQTERIKAALILAEMAEGASRELLLEDAEDALEGLKLYLRPTGLWADRLDEAGVLRDEPAPASSLYHIMAALEQARAARAWIG